MISFFSLTEVQQILMDHYGFTSVLNLAPLPGFDDQNVHVTCCDSSGSHREFVFKATSRDSQETLRLQNTALSLLSQKGFPVPTVVPCTRGDLTISANNQFIRLLTYLPGTLMKKDSPPDMFYSLGVLFGRMDIELQSLHYTQKRIDFMWDLRESHMFEKYIHIVDPSCRYLVQNVFKQFHTIQPLLLRARSGVVHNDIKDVNTILSGNNILGVIDFSDMCFSAHVCNLAIGVAQLLGTDKDSLFRVARLVAGYQSVFPLSEEEFVLLPLLAATRLAACFVGATHFSTQDPTNMYVHEHIQQSYSPLRFLLSVGFDEVLRVFRAAVKNPY